MGLGQKKLFLIALAAFYFLAPSLAASAENQPSSGYPADVPKAYIDEALGYAAYCADNNFMRQYYNCDCLGAKFLDARIARGDLATKEEIANSLAKECRDATEASGIAYENCLKTASTMTPGTDPEKLCECVGNTYSKLIDRDKPVIESRIIVTFSARARVMCEDPDAARSLNLKPPK